MQVLGKFVRHITYFMLFMFILVAVKKAKGLKIKGKDGEFIFYV